MTMETGRDLPRVLVLDIDGVLTDGSVGTGPGGGRRVHLRDIDALTRAREAGIRIAFLTGESAKEVGWIVARCAGGEVLYGAKDKGRGLAELAEKLGVPTTGICYVGDAPRDVGALKTAGLGLAPSDADGKAKNAASIILENPGGRGAVAEAVEILKGERKAEAVEVRLSEGDSLYGKSE